ncbi:MAG TPA: glycosyltransferase family 39 protein [Solirubrobacteraceae bacterium]|nr:glycosyltransferase family 39 protein [Solirubrobacteraceae bacterium]
MRERLAVWGPAALAAVLCLISLTGRSIAFDEAATVSIVVQNGGALGSAIAHDGGNMSGYYVLMHVLIALFGNGLFLIRLPSVISIAAAVALTGTIALRLFDARVAFTAGLLSAVSMPLVFWGQDARGYAPMVALVAASFLSFVCLVEDERPRRGAWVAYFVTTTLAAYCGFDAILVVPAQLVMLWWRPGAARAVITALVCSVVCWIPLVVLAVRRGSSQLFWVPHLSLTVDKQMLEALTSAGLQPSFHANATMWALIVLTVLGVAAVAVVHVRRAARPARGRRTELWGQALVLLWLFIPVVLAFAESEFGQPIFIARNLLMCLPAVALVLAVGVCDRRLPGVLSGGALVALLVLRLLALAPTYGVSPEDWQQATAYVIARAQPRDCAVFYPLDARMAFEYYVARDGARSRAPRSVLPVLPWGVVKPYVEDYATLPAGRVPAIAASCSRLWLISSHEGQPHGPSARSRANWSEFLMLRALLERAYRSHVRVQFSYAATIHVDLLSDGRARGAPSRRRTSAR